MNDDARGWCVNVWSPLFPVSQKSPRAEYPSGAAHKTKARVFGGLVGRPRLAQALLVLRATGISLCGTIAILVSGRLFPHFQLRALQLFLWPAFQ